jgi:hypothetical protein
MTSQPATRPDDQGPDIAAAVQALHPRLTQLSLLASLGILVTGIATLVVLSLAMGLDDNGEGDRLKVGLFAVLMGGILIAVLTNWMRRQQEALVMPTVAKAVGLTYQKDGKGFVRGLPSHLLPRGTQQKAEDYVTGRMGKHIIRMAEVTVETGGKNSETLFDGLVAAVSFQSPKPGFLLAPPRMTAPGVLFGAWIPTDDLVSRRDVTCPGGNRLQLWTKRQDGAEPVVLEPLVQAILALEQRIPAPVSLFTALSTGSEVYLALTHKRNLYRIGGFFPSHDQVLVDVRTATGDLTIALGIAQELIAAEAALPKPAEA